MSNVQKNCFHCCINKYFYSNTVIVTENSDLCVVAVEQKLHAVLVSADDALNNSLYVWNHASSLSTKQDEIKAKCKYN